MIIPGRFDEALVEQNKAIEIDPTLAEGYAALGFAYISFELDWKKAEEYLKAGKAQKRAVSYAHNIYDENKHMATTSLEKEVNNIEQEYRKIRQGNIGILRNQVLASTILKASSTETANKAIKKLMIQANLNALQATSPEKFDSKQQAIKIDPNQLNQLKQQVADRRNYVVRVFSTGNYVMGDQNIQVFIDATPDRKLFDQDEKIANVSINPKTMNEEQIRQQLNILLVTSQLSARRAGILDDRPQVGDGQLSTYVQFLEQIKKQKYPISIRAIVNRDIHTLGPLAIELQAIANNKVLFSTYSNAAINSSSVH